MTSNDPSASAQAISGLAHSVTAPISHLRAVDVVGDRSEIFAMNPDDSVEVAAQKLRNWHVRTSAVCDDVGNVAGIFGQSDIASRVVAAGLEPKHVAVREVMTREPVCVDVETDLMTCVHLMRRHGISHLVLTRTNAEGEQYFGMISANDVLGVVARLATDEGSSWFRDLAG